MNLPDVTHAIDQLWYSSLHQDCESVLAVVRAGEVRSCHSRSEPTAVAEALEAIDATGSWERWEEQLQQTFRSQLDRCLVSAPFLSKSGGFQPQRSGSEAGPSETGTAVSTEPLVDSPWHETPRPARELAKSACVRAFLCRFWLDVYLTLDEREEASRYAAERLRRIPEQLQAASDRLQATLPLDARHSALARWLEAKVRHLKRRVAWLQLPAASRGGLSRPTVPGPWTDSASGLTAGGSPRRKAA